MIFIINELLLSLLYSDIISSFIQLEDKRDNALVAWEDIIY